MNQTSGRIAIIGGGPIGLAACAHALAHGLDPVVIEAGTGVGEHLRQWGHVRMFTPWGMQPRRSRCRTVEGFGMAATRRQCLPDRAGACGALSGAAGEPA